MKVKRLKETQKIARSFEELKVYQKAKDLTNAVYTLTKKGAFIKDYGLADQIRRSSVSVMSNIAEGFERGSRPDFIRFLFIAKGSCGELRAQLEIAKDQGYISEQDYIQCRDNAKNISGITANFIKHLKLNPKR
jgi:four helix bundle protein